MVAVTSVQCFVLKWPRQAEAVRSRVSFCSDLVFRNSPVLIQLTFSSFRTLFRPECVRDRNTVHVPDYRRTGTEPGTCSHDLMYLGRTLAPIPLKTRGLSVHTICNHQTEEEVRPARHLTWLEGALLLPSAVGSRDVCSTGQHAPALRAHRIPYQRAAHTADGASRARTAHGQVPRKPQGGRDRDVARGAGGA